MRRTLTPRSTLETLKKDAKSWLRALRAGDAKARRRLLAVLPGASSDPGLRDVQLGLAREYGLPGWAALRQALDDLALARQSHANRVDIVLRSSNWGGDRTAAARILTRWPEIGSDNLYAAVVTGNMAEVKRRLAADPAAAARKGGPLDREPLLYLAYARLPGGEAHGPELALALLDCGADANARWIDDWGNPFTVLTGIIGQGEGDQPPHPQAEELARLLIEHGADPYDSQALYNTSITRDDITWLDILWAESARRNRLERWKMVPETTSIGGTIRLNALDYLLGNAVASNHPKRAEWLLVHGAEANGLHAYSKRRQREEALIHGHREIADLLVRFGAAATPLEGQAAFQAACMQLDRETARALALRHPDYLQNAEPMLVAARGRPDVVAMLLDLGMDVDVADTVQQRGLHTAVAAGSIEIVKLLVAHGADIDRPTTQQGGGALGFAAHFNRRDIAVFLAPLSREVHNLTYLGMRARLTELFAVDPSLVNAVHPKLGITPLFALPQDEDEALEMAEFLLAQGADAAIRNKDGFTPEEAARRNGLTDVADLLGVGARG